MDLCWDSRLQEQPLLSGQCLSTSSPCPPILCLSTLLSLSLPHSLTLSLSCPIILPVSSFHLSTSHRGFIAGEFSTTSGSFPGLSSSTLGRSYPWDQGIALPAGPCSYDTVWNGYKCTSNSSSFVTPPMNLLLKPNPIPPAGIFGDPQLFVLESRCEQRPKPPLNPPPSSSLPAFPSSDPSYPPLAS